MATILQKSTETPIIAARSTASATPVSGDTGYVSNADGGMVRTYIDKVSGTVSALTVRMYTRRAGGTTWAAGDLSTVDTTLLAAAGRIAVDWFIGEEMESTFAFETISGGGTAALAATAVQS